MNAGRAVIRETPGAPLHCQAFPDGWATLLGAMFMTHSGSCFCVEVKFEVTGEPVAMGYCHCSSCRHWSAGPVNAFTLWQPTAVRVTRGGDNIGTYNKTPQSSRKWCKTCGGHIFTEHPTWGVTDVYAAIIPDLPYKAGLHVNYQEK